MMATVAETARKWWPVLIVLVTIIAAWGRMEQRLNQINAVITPDSIQEYGAVKARLEAVERRLDRLER